VQLVDDLNGEEAQETVRFGFEGSEYEIDLTEENANKLRSFMSEYVEKGRKVGGKRSQGGAKSTNRNKRENTQEIRQWAQANGHNPSSRGRINQSIIDAYNEAHS
jgi:hypothetical protein